jgi:hypothetical protein
MSSVQTVYLPLTTTFTAPAKCENTPYIVLNRPTAWWKVGGDTDPTCFPPAFPFSKSSIVYSPGICPAGWSSACHQAVTRSGSTENVVSCCPSYVPRSIQLLSRGITNTPSTDCRSFECVSTNIPLSKWQEVNGCVSPFSVNSKAWPSLTSGKPYIASIYQQQVMIVESTVRPTLHAGRQTKCANKTLEFVFRLTTSDCSFRSCAQLCTDWQPHCSIWV